jgi:hypothetical protein
VTLEARKGAAHLHVRCHLRRPTPRKPRCRTVKVAVRFEDSDVTQLVSRTMGSATCSSHALTFAVLAFMLRQLLIRFKNTVEVSANALSRSSRALDRARKFPETASRIAARRRRAMAFTGD